MAIAVTVQAVPVKDAVRTTPAQPKPKRIRSALGAEWLMLIPMLFLAGAFLVPLVLMVITSFTEPSPQNYAEMLDSPLYLRSLLTTLKIAVIVTVVALLLGYPVAYVMHHGGPRWRSVLLVLVLLPFMSSLLVRTFAWTAILGDAGVINRGLQALHLRDTPLPLMGNTIGTVIGMTHVLLPYLVLPLYATMRRIDPTLLPAALSLGASRLKAFIRVFLPLTAPGAAAGAVLVFVLSIGFYITPELLGGPRDLMLGQLIVRQVSPLLQFGMAAALGVVLLLVILAVLGIAGRFVAVGKIVGYEEQR